MKLYALTVNDIGDTSDCHSGLMDVFATREDARSRALADMDGMMNSPDAPTFGIVDREELELFTDESCQTGYAWDIHEIDTNKVR